MGQGHNGFSLSKRNRVPAAAPTDFLKVYNFSLCFNGPADNLEKRNLQQLGGVLLLPGISLDSITYRTWDIVQQ